jgi:hypothetical protein
VCSRIIRCPHQQVKLLHARLNSKYLLHQHCTYTRDTGIGFAQQISRVRFFFRFQFAVVCIYRY